MKQKNNDLTYNELLAENERLKKEIEELKTISSRESITLEEDFVFLSTIINSIPQPIFVKDTKLRYKLCNKAFAKDIIGKKYEDIIDRDFTSLSDSIPPDLAIHYQQMDEKLFETGGIQRYEGKVKCSDGNTRTFLFHKTILYSPNQIDAIGIIGIMIDINQQKIIQDELRYYNTRLMEVSKVTNDAIWFWDIPKDHLTWGEGLTEIFGYSQEQIFQNIGWWYEQLHPEDAESVIEGIHSAINGNDEFWNDEYRFRRADGSFAIVQDRGKISRDVNGNAYFMCGGITDITQLREIEIQLRENEERFRSLFENIPDPIMIVELETGKITQANNASLAFTGYSTNEIIGKTIYDFHIYDELQRLGIEFSKMSSAAPALPPVELNLVLKNGVSKPAEIHGMIFNYEGKDFIIGAFRDLSVRKKSETELRESEERYRNLVEHSPNGIVIHQDLRLVYANESALKIMKFNSSDDLIGKSIIDFVHHDSLELVKKRISLLKSPNDYLPFVEEKLIRADGETIYCNVSGSLILYNGRPATQIIFIDTTERKKIEQKLEESNKAKDTFLSILAHDLRNPFQAIIGLSSGLKNNYCDISDVQRQKFISDIHRNSKLTYQLVDNLLMWARSQSGKIKPLPTVINAKNLINEIFRNVSMEFEKKNISLTENIHANLQIFADRDMLHTILRNILGNAAKFTNRDGNVSVISEEETDRTILLITDDGIGMNQETVDNLFRIDVASSSTGTEDEKGTGLGLILTKEFVEMNNGTITVSSTPGNGSTFIISLPNSPNDQHNERSKL